MSDKTVSEEKMRQLGLNLFYGEFVFSDLWFTSRHFEQKSNRELADLIVCVGKEMIAFQVKERNTAVEGNIDKWVNEKVEKCKKQLKDTYQYLQLDDLKEFANEKGDTVPFGETEVFWGLAILDKQGLAEYPKLKFSKTLMGFIQCFSYEDFKKCCDQVGTPKDMTEYLGFRQDYFTLDEKEKDSEDDCIRSFLTEKYGVSNPDKRGMDAFKDFLSVFKDRRVSGFGEEKQYREIVKFLAYLNRVEIGAFVTCLNNTIYDAKRKYLSYNKCMGPMKNTNAGIIFIACEEGITDKIKMVVDLCKYKKRFDSILAAVIYFETDTNFRIDWYYLEQEWEYSETMEKLINEPELASLWNGGKKVINR